MLSRKLKQKINRNFLYKEQDELETPIAKPIILINCENALLLVWISNGTAIDIQKIVNTYPLLF